MIVLSRAGVQLIDLVVGHKCFVGDDEGILIMGSPIARLAGLLIAVWRGRCSLCDEVGRRSRCGEDVVCAVDAFACAIDDGRWILEART